MTDLKTLIPDHLERFLDAAVALTFPCTSDMAHDLLHTVGLQHDEDDWDAFTIQEIGGGAFMCIDPGDSDGVSQISMTITAPKPEPTPDDTNTLADHFAIATSQVTQQLGKPTKRSNRNGRAAIQWMLPNGGRITLSHSAVVSIALDSPSRIALDGAKLR